jgi:ABC-2 type transport system ATP-binding protein
MTPALKFENLTKTYRERGTYKRALNGISFDVEAGEIVGFLGPNGAGKTTAMHVLMDILFPTSGRAEIMGFDSRDPESRQQVGFLPEVFAFDGFLTGTRFLKLFGSLSGRNQDLVAGHIPELLAFLDMRDAANVRIKNYSKGMTQKIGLAQALIGDPQILILDEPTSGMDPIAKARIKQLFVRLRSEGKTVFLSTHILSDVEDIADRVAIINQGELLAYDKVSSLLAADERGYKIVFTGGAAELWTALSGHTKHTDDRGRMEVTCPDRESKDLALQVILRHGGDIVSLKALGGSLQSQFLRLMHQEGLSDD